MMLDTQLFSMIKDRFDSVDAKLDAAKCSFDEHAEKDAVYWRVLDEQQAQLSLIKRVFWGGVSLAGTVMTYMGLKH